MSNRTSFFHRLRIGLRYAMNPGGMTNKARLSKAEAEARRKAMTDRLRAELSRAESVDRIAYMAVSEALIHGGRG